VKWFDFENTTMKNPKIRELQENGKFKNDSDVTTLGTQSSNECFVGPMHVSDMNYLTSILLFPSSGFSRVAWSDS
jgi:hypothetical protein